MNIFAFQDARKLDNLVSDCFMRCVNGKNYLDLTGTVLLIYSTGCIRLTLLYNGTKRLNVKAVSKVIFHYHQKKSVS